MHAMLSTCQAVREQALGVAAKCPHHHGLLTRRDKSAGARARPGEARKQKRTRQKPQRVRDDHKSCTAVSNAAKVVGS